MYLNVGIREYVVRAFSVVIMYLICHVLGFGPLHLINADSSADEILKIYVAWDRLSYTHVH